MSLGWTSSRSSDGLEVTMDQVVVPGVTAKKKVVDQV